MSKSEIFSPEPSFLLDREEEVSARKSRQKYPSGWLVTLQLAKTNCLARSI
jgi:hypothetical protein